MSTPLNTLLCNLPSFHKHYSNEKPFRASLTTRQKRVSELFTGCLLLKDHMLNGIQEVS